MAFKCVVVELGQPPSLTLTYCILGIVRIAMGDSHGIV